MRKLYIPLLIAMFSLVAATPLAQAQEGQPRLVFFHQVVDDPEPVGDLLRLRLFFMLKDRQGQTLTDNLDQQGRLAILDDQLKQVDVRDVTVAKPQTPIKIALVLDNSGSMNASIKDSNGAAQPMMEVVKGAAINAIKAAPAQSEFAIFSFAQQQQLLNTGNDFLDRDSQNPLIVDAINAIQPQPVRTGNTCLYDAALKAITYLNEHEDKAAPEERKAVILFTDGRDKEGDDHRNNGNNCTAATENEVINLATLSSNRIIPIYVVGPCSDAACGNIERDKLDIIAQKTNTAPAAIASQEKIADLFTQTMASISSQWVVEANVLAHKGKNQATLIVQFGTEQVTGSIPFDSPDEYSGEVTVRLTQDQYDPDNESYPTTLTIANPQRLASITVEVYDSAQGGQRINRQQYSYTKPDAKVQFALSTDGLEINKEYFIRISGTMQNGPTINPPILDDKGERHDTYPFKHDPKLKLAISHIEYSADGGELLLTVEPQNFGQRNWRTDIESVIVTDVAAKNSLPATPKQPITDIIRIATPQMLQAATVSREFSFALKLKGDAAKDITVDPHIQPLERPAGLGFFVLLGRALLNPLVLAGIFVIIVGGIAITLYLRRPRKREISRPFNLPGYTKIVDKRLAEASARAALPPTPAAPAGIPPRSPAELRQPEPAAAPKPQPKAEQNTKTTFDFPAPPQQHMIVMPPVPTQPLAWRVTVRVFRKNMAQPISETQVVHFPCKIGRADGSGSNGDQPGFSQPAGTIIPIIDDPKISREHLVIELKEGKLLFFDNKSTNGSFIGTTKLTELEPNGLRELTRVRLGPNITVELEPRKDDDADA